MFFDLFRLLYSRSIHPPLLFLLKAFRYLSPSLVRFFCISISSISSLFLRAYAAATGLPFKVFGFPRTPQYHVRETHTIFTPFMHQESAPQISGSRLQFANLSASTNDATNRNLVGLLTPTKVVVRIQILTQPHQ